MRFRILLFILFSYSPTFASDIFDYEMDGISIGNSLLDHYSYSEITSSDINEYPGSNIFYDTKHHFMNIIFLFLIIPVSVFNWTKYIPDGKILPNLSAPSHLT